MVVAVVMQGDAVEFFERIDHFPARRRQSAVERHAFKLHRPRSTDVDAITLFHIPEIDRVYPFPLVRDNWGLHMANQRPLRRPKEWMCFNVRGPRPSP